MPLCGLCKSAPFNNLPPLPECYSGMTMPWKNLIKYLALDREEGPSTQDRDFGYLHHPNLEALKESASTCELCSLLYGEAAKIPAAFEEGKKDKTFVYYKRDEHLPDYQLRLTRRQDGSDGFLVWSTTPGPGTYLLAGVGFCVDDTDSQAFAVRGRPIEEDSSSVKVLNRVLSWVQRCDSKHSGCKFIDVPLLPQRVIDVGDANSDMIRLYEPLKGTTGSYTTLSHCWGQTRQYTTTLSTISSRKEGINTKDLPKTFRDAVSVTRYIGIKYLWVDSICICQDDLGDWQRASAQMEAVYSNSYLSIAAAHSKDDSFGVFSQRPVQRYVPLSLYEDAKPLRQVLAFTIPLLKATPMEYLKMHDEPLVHRAWVLQERCLAPRTVHYATDQMYFECHEEFLSEDGFRYMGRYLHLDVEDEGDKMDPRKGRKPPRASQRWYNLIWEYSRRKLTVSSDKLPALSGLAKKFATQLDDDYIAGIWRSQLIEGLSWQSMGDCSRPTDYRAPSWSWAAIDGHIGILGLGDFTDLATVVDCQVQIRGDNPFGEVESGWVKLRAPLEPLVASDEPETDWETVPHERNIRFCIPGGDTFGSYSMFDVKNEAGQLRSLSLFVLFLAVSINKPEGSPDSAVYQALMVTPIMGSKDHFRRVGKMLMSSDDVKACRWASGEDTTLPIVELV